MLAGETVDTEIPICMQDPFMLFAAMVAVHVVGKQCSLSLLLAFYITIEVFLALSFLVYC